MDGQTKSFVTAVEKLKRSSSASSMAAGKAAQVVIDSRLRGMTDPGSRRTTRAKVVEYLGSVAKDAGHATRPSELNRLIAVHWVGVNFDPKQAATIALSSLIQFARLLKRQPKDETWQIRNGHDDKARALWSRVVSGDVLTCDVRQEVDAVLGRKPRMKRPVDKVKQTMVQISKLAPEQQRELYLALRSIYKKQQQQHAPEPLPQTVGTIAEVIEPPPEQKGSLREALGLGKKAA